MIEIDFLYKPKWGSTVRVRGVPNAGGSSFNVNMRLSSTGQFVFHLNMHYSINLAIFDTMNQNNEWESQEHAGDLPIREGQEFLLEITCNKDEFVVRINKTWEKTFKQRQNYLLADRLQLAGEMVPIEVTPEVKKCSLLS